MNAVRLDNDFFWLRAIKNGDAAWQAGMLTSDGVRVVEVNFETQELYGDFDGRGLLEWRPYGERTPRWRDESTLGALRGLARDRLNAPRAVVRLSGDRKRWHIFDIDRVDSVGNGGNWRGFLSDDCADEATAWIIALEGAKHKLQQRRVE